MRPTTKGCEYQRIPLTDGSIVEQASVVLICHVRQDNHEENKNNTKAVRTTVTASDHRTARARAGPLPSIKRLRLRMFQL
ncbi:hypothetical protein CTI12_AA156550 [Artemisia annua]|uniref:Uncharacterized protein n=1 Tax=Artemisia annua TaxID=35608 RepID=A0A2U1PG43_ARTAN|nr:hypothetical protein CTI12_AA156550 [Artemisia annua]